MRIQKRCSLPASYAIVSESDPTGGPKGGILRYSHGKVTRCCTSVFLYVGFAVRRRQSQYIKPAKYFFTDIAGKTATARTQHVHGTVVAFSLAISRKMRYRIIFKGSPLCPMVCMQISRYSRRNRAIESDCTLCVSAPVRYANTETREHCPFHAL